MMSFASLRAGCRRAALPCVAVAVLLAPASAAQAQRLLTLVPGVGQAASAGGLGPSIGPVPTAARVDLNLLRSAPARLEVPTPDGGVLSAERSVFEDRGGGDLMWSGGQPGAGYDTVVLTVEGGRLVGRFGAAGGGAYQIHAERDGRGGIAPLVGPVSDGPVPWCGVEAGADGAHDAHAHAHVRAGAFAADLPERVSSPEGHDRLDILVAYTATAAENWADRGGAHAAIRHAGDYLKMVFRNNRIEVEPHIVHVAQASAALDRAGRDLGRHLYEGRSTGGPLDSQVNLDGDLLRLRHEYRADFVHLFTGERALLWGACGRNGLLSKEPGIVPSPGRSTNHPLHCPDYAVTFVHELGHGLGASHDPANAGFPPEFAYRPYAFGHVDLDVMPALGTAMSYRGQIEPFFSTPRIRPWGAVAGIADERDNERLLRETVHIAARVSDYLRSLEGVPAPPSDLRVRLEGDTFRLSWRDNAPDADGYEVYHVWTPIGDYSRFRRRMVEGRSGAIVPLGSTVPGTYNRFEVRATRGDVRSLRSNAVAMVVPGDPIAAPSDVSVTVDGHSIVIDVQWTDNSDNESWFDVQLLQDGEPIHRERAAEDSERSAIYGSWVRHQQGAEYGVRVFAYNSSGYSGSSEVATFQWENPAGPAPVTGVSIRATGPTSVRVAWAASPETYLYDVRALLPHWEAQRKWELAHSASKPWIDFEGLARGGRYVFRIGAAGGWRTRVHGVPYYSVPFALGGRGTGPRAPSDVAWVYGGNRARVNWKDNSSDELGFEIQYGLIGSDGNVVGVGGPRWHRLLTAPADAESAVSDIAEPSPGAGWVFRVFAYNDRGYSRASAPSGSCRADGETLCLRDSRFQVKVNWWSADSESGVGRVVEDRTDDSGMFRFFGPENWEVLIKVLDGCRTNGRVWVLGASTTDLGYRIRVADTLTEEARTYTNEPGRPAPAIVDTKAFSGACR